MSVIGLITVNGKEILEVDADPTTGGGIAAPTGSIAMWDNAGVGVVYFKFGAGNTDWSQFDITPSWDLTGNTLTGATADAPDQFIGSLNDYDVRFLRNNVEQMRIQNAAILMGLAASQGGRLQVYNTEGADLFKELTDHAVSGLVSHVTRMYSYQSVASGQASMGTISVPTDASIIMSVKVIARQTAGTGVNNSFAYIRDIMAKNVTGSTTVQKQQSSFTAEDSRAFNFSIDASGTDLLLNVNPNVTDDVIWNAHVSFMLAAA